jgi:hypothetical protein
MKRGKSQEYVRTLRAVAIESNDTIREELDEFVHCARTGAKPETDGNGHNLVPTGRDRRGGTVSFRPAYSGPSAGHTRTLIGAGAATDFLARSSSAWSCRSAPLLIVYVWVTRSRRA